MKSASSVRTSADPKSKSHDPAASDQQKDAPPPPHGQVMQLVMGAWISQTISSVTRLNVPDIVQKHGALTAKALVEQHGVNGNVEFLQRALRACASVGIF